MSTDPPTPLDSTEVQESLLSGIKVCSDATVGAVIKAMQFAFDDGNMEQAGGMAATAAQSAAAAHELTQALSTIRTSFETPAAVASNTSTS